MSADALLDVYTLRARVYPGLLALLPLGITYAAAFPKQVTSLTSLGPLLLAAGALYLLSQFIRQAGKAKEPVLWRKWGGKPTTALLRLRVPVTPPSRDLVRSRLARIAPDVVLPTLQEERADPAAADRRYDAAVSVLREATRSIEQFPVVFAENVTYGFRRNTWAIKPVGVVFSLVALLAAAVVARQGGAKSPTPLLWVALAMDIFFTAFWLFTVTEKWVRRSAIAYAEALFAASAEVARR